MSAYKGTVSLKKSRPSRRIKDPIRLERWHILAGAFLIFSALSWLWRRPSSAATGAPLHLGPEPKQELLTLPLSRLLFREGDFSRLELTHRFEITGEAIAVTSYRWSFTNPFYKVDLGLAWGPRVKEYKKKLSFRQSARWLMWSFHEQVDEVTQHDVQTHLGNLHLIPAEGRPDLAKAIDWMQKGDLVRITGYLVRILGPGAEVLAVSSTSREDSGDGACEIIWVEELQIGSKIYR